MFSLAEKEQIIDAHTRKVLLLCYDAIRVRFPTAQLILFGSQARGDADSESDIDLLVLLDEEVNSKLEREIWDNLYDIELQEDVVVSSIIRNKHEWQTPTYQEMPLNKIIQQEGIQVA